MPTEPENQKGILSLDGKDYVFEIREGKRFINGVDALEFIRHLPAKTLIRIISQALVK